MELQRTRLVIHLKAWMHAHMHACMHPRCAAQHACARLSQDAQQCLLKGGPVRTLRAAAACTCRVHAGSGRQAGALSQRLCSTHRITRTMRFW